MKKNRGQKSSKKENKGSLNPSHWRDSMKNYKHFCLHCFKTFKQGNKCCGWETYVMHPDARPPKQRDGKAKWKQFFQLFLGGHRVDRVGQMERIIAIRKSYGLSTLEQETKLKEMKVVKEEIFGLFDIKRHEAKTINGYGDEYKLEKELLNQISDKAKKDTAVQEKDYKHNTEYFLVPIVAGNYGELIIPTTLGYFNIYKARGYVSKDRYSAFEWHVKAETKKEIVHSLYNDDNRFAYRQSILCFDTKVKALAFRQSYLTALYPILKSEGLDYLKEVVKTVNIDFDRVVKKAPELLI